jgi:hypothetical protein
MVVACLALAVALSGTGYAVAKLPRNSVGTAQLKANAVMSSKVAPNSVRGDDVVESSLQGIPTRALAGGSCSIGSKQGVIVPRLDTGDLSNSGALDVVVTCVTTDSSEASGGDDTRASREAYVDPIGSDYNQTVFPAGDSDWFEFSLSMPSIHLESIELSPTAGARMDVEVADGQDVTGVLDWHNDLLSAETEKRGPWIVRVYGVKADHYRLSVFGHFD